MKAKFAGDSESDHIALLRAFEGWERNKRRDNVRQYCWDHFLSHNTLEVWGCGRGWGSWLIMFVFLPFVILDAEQYEKTICWLAKRHWFPIRC